MKLEDLQPVHGGLRHNPNPATLDMISFELDCTVDLIFGVHELMERERCDAAGYKAALWATACHLQTICGELHAELYEDNTPAGSGAPSGTPPYPKNN